MTGRREISPYQRSQALLALDLRLQRGDTEEQAVAFLVSQGFAEHEARAEVERIVRAGAASARTKGWVWPGWGGACILAGAAITWRSAASSRSSRLGRGRTSAISRRSSSAPASSARAAA